MRVAAALALMFATGLAHAQVAGNCSSLSQPRSMPVQPTVVAPIAPELVAPTHQLGAPTGVLSQAFDESLAVDQVLYRIKLEGCPNLASIAPAAPVAPALTDVPSVEPGTTAPDAAAATTDAAAYQPKTEFDNTPWRFDMHQNGKNMTADEFTAWMKAKGVRIATGAAKPEAPAAVATGTASPGAAATGGQQTPGTAGSAASPATSMPEAAAPVESDVPVPEKSDGEPLEAPVEQTAPAEESAADTAPASAVDDGVTEAAEVTDSDGR